MIWNEKYECMPINERKELQLERLSYILNYAYDKIPYYKKSFDEKGVKPSDFKKLSDLSKFPTLTKHEMRDNYPFGLFAQPSRKYSALACVLGYHR